MLCLYLFAWIFGKKDTSLEGVFILGGGGE